MRSRAPRCRERAGRDFQVPPPAGAPQPDHGLFRESEGAGGVRDGVPGEPPVVVRGERLPRRVARGDDDGRGEPQPEAHAELPTIETLDILSLRFKIVVVLDV